MWLWSINTVPFPAINLLDLISLGPGRIPSGSPGLWPWLLTALRTAGSENIDLRAPGDGAIWCHTRAIVLSKTPDDLFAQEKYSNILPHSFVKM